MNNNIFDSTLGQAWHLKSNSIYLNLWWANSLTPTSINRCQCDKTYTNIPIVGLSAQRRPMIHNHQCVSRTKRFNFNPVLCVLMVFRCQRIRRNWQKFWHCICTIRCLNYQTIFRQFISTTKLSLLTLNCELDISYVNILLYILWHHPGGFNRYSDVIMSATATQIIGVLIDYTTVCSGADKKSS